MLRDVFISSRIVYTILLCLDEDEKGALASASKDVAMDTSWEQVYLKTFGERLCEPPAGNIGNMRASRRRSSPRATYFKELRLLSRRWHYIFMSFHRRDYSAAKLRALLSRWRFPAPHVATGTLTLSEHQVYTLNRPHQAFEWAPILCVAARYRRWSAVKGLIEVYKVNPCAVDARGMNALITAAWCGHVTMVKYLINHSTPEQLELQKAQMGTPHMTSACGGKGPFTAYTWAKRKADICAENEAWHSKWVAFNKVCKLLGDKEEKTKAKEKFLVVVGDTSVSDGSGIRSDSNNDEAVSVSNAVIEDAITTGETVEPVLSAVAVGS